MTVDTDPSQGHRTRVDDGIRIVPMYIPEELITAPAVPAAPAARMTYRGGPLLTNVQVFTTFWGAAWQAGQAPLRQQLNQFFDYVTASPLIDQLAEYSAPTKVIGRGTRVGTATITTPTLRHTVSDATIRQVLQREIANNTSFPKPNSNLLYFLYLPPGVSVSQGGGRSCMSFCGYHDSIGGTIFYAVMPFAGCNGCLGGMSALDALTTTSSHELCEAITDAVPGQGWYDDHHGEIGDVCAWTTKKLGAYTVQLEWSNQAGGCK
jgi:hypothetical protein